MNIRPNRPWKSASRRLAGTLLALAALSGQAAEVANWTAGKTPGNYHDPAHWDLGVVPINNASQTYVVVIPGQAQVQYDVDGAVRVDAFRLDADATFTLDGAREFTVEGISVLNGPVLVSGEGAVFRSDLDTATLNGRARFSVQAGGQLFVDAPSFTLPEDWRSNRALFQADGAGSLLDLHGLKTLTTPGGHGGAWDYSVIARNGGVLDLSGLTKATGPRDTYSNDDWLTFRVQSGGQLKLDQLTQIAWRVRLIPEEDWALPSLEAVELGFFLPTAGVTLELPVFRTMGGGQLNLLEGATIDAPQLTAIQNTRLTVATNATFHGGQVSDLSGSTIVLEAGGTLELGAVSLIDRMSFVARATPVLTSSATRYELPEQWGGNRRLFEADGAGVTLDLRTVRTLKTGGGWGAQNYSIVVKNGGTIDLSGLTEAIGPLTKFGGDDWLTFYFQSGGRVDLSALRKISRRVRFLPAPGEPVHLPALEEVAGGQFKLPTGSVLDAPALRRIDTSGFGAWLEVDFAGEVNAPVLGELVGVGVTVRAGGVIRAPQATNIVNTSLNIAGGGRLEAPRVRNLSGSALTLDPGETLILGDIAWFDRLQLVAKATPTFTFSATSYRTPDDWRTHRTPFEADGVGVHLALGSLETLVVPGGQRGAWKTSIIAMNGGSLDLSGLRTIMGGVGGSNWADDWLTLRCETGGQLDLGDATVSRVARLQIVGAQARMKAAGLHLRRPARLEISAFGTLEVGGALDFNHTDESQIVADEAILAFAGSGAHRLEVGGQDAGPDGFTAGNFGFGRLAVGQAGAPATLLLVDAFDNGNRVEGQPEALYLYGVESEGLALAPGSKLVLGELNVYTLHAGAMTHLNALLADRDAAAFGDGVIARFGGPAIVAMTPSGQTLPVVDHVDVTFNTPIEAATFTPEDVQLTGPGGAIPVTSVSALDERTYRIAFPGQSEHGYLQVRVGPDLADVTGLLSAMDQNGNGATGDPDDVFAGQLLVDTRGPAVTSAVAIRNSGLVGARFDEAVEPASFADPAHYAIGGAQPDSVVPRADGRTAALYFPPLTGDTFLLETVDLTDLLGNTLTAPQQFAGTVLPLNNLKVGNPKGVREAYTCEGTTFEAQSGYGAVWRDADHFQFYSEPRTGDFDVMLRVAALSSPQHWAHLGLMAREHAGANSRYLSVVAYQPNRANVYGFHRRSSQGGNSDRWANDVTGVLIPQGRLRLQRLGSTFRAYTSTDGSHWTQRAETTFELPETLLVGFFVDPEDWSRAATATIADWGEYSPAILRGPADQTVFRNQTARLAVEARGVGELSYQWHFNGAPLPGATEPVLELANIQPARAGEYYVVVQNEIGALTSRTATVVVDTSDPGAGFEADLLPRGASDGTVSVADWTMVGRLAVGLETPANASEFTRADCAPRSTLGNGVIGVTDWVQAGRYVAGLEPPTPAGGPNGIAPASAEAAALAPTASRELSLAALPSEPGRLRVGVRLQALGNENSVSFSVGFDAGALELARIVPGRAASAAHALLLSNSQGAAEGRAGVALALPAGARLAPGAAELAVLEFAQRTDAATVLTLAGQPVAVAVAGADAEPLAAQVTAAQYRLRNPRAGVLRIVAPRDGATVTRLEFHGAPNTRVALERSTDLRQWRAAGATITTDADGNARFAAEIGDAPQFFRVRRAD